MACVNPWGTPRIIPNSVAVCVCLRISICVYLCAVCISVFMCVSLCCVCLSACVSVAYVCLSGYGYVCGVFVSVLVCVSVVCVYLCMYSLFGVCVYVMVSLRATSDWK